MMGHYYKFRSLNNIRYFLDILVNNRLYAARYDELNDPMEGAYLINACSENIIRLLRDKKYKTRLIHNINQSIVVRKIQESEINTGYRY